VDIVPNVIVAAAGAALNTAAKAKPPEVTDLNNDIMISLNSELIHHGSTIPPTRTPLTRPPNQNATAVAAHLLMKISVSKRETTLGFEYKRKYCSYLLNF
jgi:hypothetical protein